MFHDVQLLTVGAAAVIETALLLAMAERRNVQYVTRWMLLLTAGAWLWHTATFCYMLLAATKGEWALHLRWGLMTAMAAGLLLMPSAVLHGIWRLSRGGLGSRTRELRYLLAYLPLLMVVPVALRLRADPGAPFFALASPFATLYVAWLVAANTVSAAGSFRLRNTISLPQAKLFFTALGVLLIGITAATAFVVLFAARAWPEAAPALILAVTLLPVLPALLFAYVVIRYHFLPLILERTLVYGAIVVGLLLFHRVLLRGLQKEFDERYHVDLVILEWMAGIALVLAYPPLRRRSGEALRYLMGVRLREVRGEMQRLSVQMAEWAGEPPAEILARFAAALAGPLQVEYVAAWIFGAAGGGAIEGGTTERLSAAEAERLEREMAAAGLRSCTSAEAPSRDAQEALQGAAASTAVTIEYREIRGLLVLGRNRWHQQLGQEELNSLLLLSDQLGSTIHNSLLHAARLAAERSALQNEKLSTLGLLAGSIAHEVKNPLSSIKTIATVLAEQLSGGAHAEDLRLILGEVDRLAATTSQLLEFARPAANDGACGSVAAAVDLTLRVMRQLARQRDVTIEADFDRDLPRVRADENTLREIFFNLLSNSIDAAGPGGRVQVACRRENGCVIAEVRDSGPGIPLDLQERLFEPFFTTKEAGTGLGLYVVGRRMREMGGEVRCTSGPACGTSFVLKLPCPS